jgi:hypothetical protein
MLTEEVHWSGTSERQRAARVDVGLVAGPPDRGASIVVRGMAILKPSNSLSALAVALRRRD